MCQAEGKHAGRPGGNREGKDVAGLWAVPRVRLELWVEQAVEASLMGTESPEILGSHSVPPQIVTLGSTHYTQSRDLSTDLGLLFWRALVFLLSVSRLIGFL